MDRKSLDSLLFDTKEFSFLTQRTFRGLTITENGSGWNIVIRAFDIKGTAQYAMCQASDPAEGMRRLLGSLCTRSGASLWRYDKFYNKNGR